MTDDAPDLIDAFVRVREMLLREADAVPAELRQTPFVGHWNLMDVLAHLVGWDYTNVNAIEELKAGTTPSFYRHYDPGLGRLQPAAHRPLRCEGLGGAVGIVAAVSGCGRGDAAPADGPGVDRRAIGAWVAAAGEHRRHPARRDFGRARAPGADPGVRDFSADGERVSG